MKPGGLLDALFFASGSLASLAGVVWWSLRESSKRPMYLQEHLAVGAIAMLFGAAIYEAAQRRRLRADVLYPRRGGVAISLALGVAFPFLVGAIGTVLEPAVGNGGSVLLVLLLPWVLSRAQWTTTPPESERTHGGERADG